MVKIQKKWIGSFLLFIILCVGVGQSYETVFTEEGTGNGLLGLAAKGPYNHYTAEETFLVVKHRKYPFLPAGTTLPKAVPVAPVEITYLEIAEAMESRNPGNPYCTVGGRYTVMGYLKDGTGNLAETIKPGMVERDMGGVKVGTYDLIMFVLKELFRVAQVAGTISNVTGSPTLPLINEQFQSKDILYCQTTADLIKKVKVPSSWLDDKLIFYCNDGAMINERDENFEFLAYKINAYKACIVKNMDLDKDNTIVWGMESGNMEHDDKEEYFFDETTKTNRFLATTGLDYDSGSSGNYVYIDKNTQDKYQFRYNRGDGTYSLSSGGLSLDAPITSYFSIPSGFDLSRTILVHGLDDGGKIIGFERAGMLEGIDNLKPVYHINFPSGKTQAGCLDYLGKYKAKAGSSVGASDTVICLNNGGIVIGTNGMEVSFEGTDAFNIFKNVILDSE